MRKLLMAIFIPVLFVVGTPALLAAIMYDGGGYEDLPTHLYTEDADAQKMLYQELSDSLDALDTGANDDLEFNIHEDIINVAIYEALLENNQDYAPGDDCETDDECYFMVEPLGLGEGSEFRLVGVWAEFEEDVFIANVALDIQFNESITYKTVISTFFKIEDHPGEAKYTLQFEKIRIGNLPIPSSTISWVLGIVEDNLAEVNLDEATAGLPMGVFDLDTFTYTVEKSEIVAKIGETEEGEEPDENQEMLQEIASIILEQRLLGFDIEDEELVVSAKISKFENEDDEAIEIPNYLYDLHEVTGFDIDGSPIYGDYDVNAFDPEAYMQNVFTEYVFNNALVGGDFQISEELFNQLVYNGAQGFEDMTTVNELELPDGTIREVEVGLVGLWFTIEEDAIYANALFKLDSTMSLMKLKATKVDEVSTATELVFDFTDLTFGEDQDEAAEEYVTVENLEVFESYLVGLEDIQFGSIEETPQGVYLTISADALTAVLTEGTEEETVVINGISLSSGSIDLAVTPANEELAAVLDELTAELNTILADQTLVDDVAAVLNPDGTNEEAQELIEALDNVQDTLADPDAELTDEEVEVLFDEFDDLSEEEQNTFLNEVSTTMDQDTYDAFVAMFGEEALPTIDETTTP